LAPATGGGPSCNNWWTEANSVVKRSFFLDDCVYSITDREMKVRHLSDVTAPVAEVRLTP
jgi:hypothetical protein